DYPTGAETGSQRRLRLAQRLRAGAARPLVSPMHAARHSDLPTHLLVVGGSFFYPRELTASGLTLPREALATEPLCALRPGDLLAATLRLEGPHGAVEGRVIARLVGQEDEVAEFAFLMLPVRLRRLLDRAAPLVAGPAAQPTPRLPDTFALAFAKLDEPLGP